MAIIKGGSRNSPKSKNSARRSSFTPRSMPSSPPAYAAVCRRHNPCELCVDQCPPNSRIGCRCNNTSASSRTCRCPQKLGKKFICDTYKVRMWTEQFKARAIHGQPGLLGENKPISRKDRFSSTYSLAFIDPDSRDYDRTNVDRPAGLETMRVPPPPGDKKKPSNRCCQCSFDEGRSAATANSHVTHADECAYCGFKEGALDFRPKIRRSLKQQRRSLTMSNRTIRDAETSTNTTKSATTGGARITDEFLTKLDSMEEDLNFLNKRLLRTEASKETKANESTPKVKGHGSVTAANAAKLKSEKILEAHLIKKEQRAQDPGYAQYMQYAY